jgi:hypothetical protein
MAGGYVQRIFRKVLACFSAGMSPSMKRKFNFVKIAGNAFNTITDTLIDREYDTNVSSVAAA